MTFLQTDQSTQADQATQESLTTPEPSTAVDLSKSVTSSAPASKDLKPAASAEFGPWWLVPMAILGAGLWWFLSRRASARRERDRRFEKAPLPRITETVDDRLIGTTEKKSDPKARKRDKKKGKTSKQNKSAKPVAQPASTTASAAVVASAINSMTTKKSASVAAATAQWMESFGPEKEAENTPAAELNPQKFVAIFEPLRSSNSTSESVTASTESKESRRPLPRNATPPPNKDILRPLTAPIIRTAPPRSTSEPRRYPTATSSIAASPTYSNSSPTYSSPTPLPALNGARESTGAPLVETQQEQLESSSVSEAGKGGGSGLAAIVAKRLAAKTVGDGSANSGN